MEDSSRCWVCHRSAAEISAFADVETPHEKEIQQQLSQVNEAKAGFVESADVWRKGVPKEFKEFDFNFVTSNADQFKSIRIANGLLGEIAAPNKLLGEIGDAKRMTFDWLENAAPVLRKESGEVPGFGALSSFDKADRDMLSRMVDQFETKWHRYIGDYRNKGVDSNGYGSGFEGLKLFDGLEFMIAAGTLYYDIRAKLLDMARRKEISSKAKRGVSVLLVTGYPPVPLCSVCVDVMNELSSHAIQAASPPILASSTR